MSAPSKVIGIDPGLDGAVALLEDGEFKAVHDMPTYVDSAGKRVVDARGVAVLLHNYKPDLVVIEQVGAMPRANPKTGQKVKMGAQSMFNFGRGFGLVEAGALILQLDIEYVRPAAWQRKCGLINAEKDSHRQLAIRQFPRAADALRLKKHHGRADALLIAGHGHGCW